MSYLVFGLGLLLAICGAASISFGYGIINVERGWASVIGGAAALSGGIVTIALAMILHSLSGLRALLKAERDAPPVLPEATRLSDPPVIVASPAQARAAPAQDDAPVAPSIDDGAARTVAAGPPAGSSQRAELAAAPVAQASIEDIRRVVAQTMKRPPPERRIEIEAPAPAAEVEAGASQAPHERPPFERGPRRRPEPGPFGLPRAVDLKDIAPQHFGAAPAEAAAPLASPSRTALSASPPALDRLVSRPAGEPAPSPAAAQALLPQAPARPVENAQGTPPRRGEGRSEERSNIIGRYESEGTNYVMFADGSIDARSDRGAFHFSSMAELKAFMDAQASGGS
jgi:hypothetical protein